MNILCVDFMSFEAADFEQTWDDRLRRKTIRKIRRCGNHENPTNMGIMTTVIDNARTNINKEDKYGYEQEG